MKYVIVRPHMTKQAVGVTETLQLQLPVWTIYAFYDFYEFYGF